MDDQIIESIANSIMELMDRIKTLQPGSQEYLRATEALEKLYNMAMAEQKRCDDYCNKQQELKDDKLFKWIKVGTDILGIVAPLSAMSAVFEAVKDYEKTDVWSLSIAKPIINWFIPRRK